MSTLAVPRHRALATILSLALVRHTTSIRVGPYVITWIMEGGRVALREAAPAALPGPYGVRILARHPAGLTTGQLLRLHHLVGQDSLVVAGERGRLQKRAFTALGQGG